MKYKNIEVIECPDYQSWDLHKLFMYHMVEIAERNNMKLELKILDEEKYRFQMIIYTDDLKDQKNAFVELMEFFRNHNIAPGEVISSNLECEKVNQTLEILENV
jgi:hypothetical protein